MPSPSIFAALASATRTESSERFCSWRTISCRRGEPQLPETHLNKQSTASEFECLASSGASQTELPACRSGANQHHHHRRHHPKAKTRRSAVTGAGCEGKPMATGVTPNRSVSQPAMAASPSAGASRARSNSISSLMEFEEEQRQKHHYVSLWGSPNGERYCCPDVGGWRFSSSEQ